MGDGAAGCQVKAGVLKPDETLTDNARHQFIKEVIEEIRFGTPDLPMVCLDKIDGIGIAGVPDDLYDRDKYPSFHANYVDTYEKIAAALNVAGSIAFPPLFDFSVSIPNFDFPSIGIDFNAFFDLPGLPALAAKLPSLAPKFPNVKLPDLPKLPIPPKIPIPDLKLPDINLMPDLYFKFSAILKLPDFALSLIIPPPVFLPKIPTLDLSDICKKVKENVLPESPGAKGTGVNLLEIAAISVLTRKISQCLTITITACLFGAGSFLCGGLGQKLNVAPEPEPEPPPPPPPTGVREAVVSAGNSAVGYNSAHKADIETYVTYLFPYDVSDTNPRGKAAGYDFGYSLVKGKNQQGIIVPGAKYFSACAVAALSVHIHGGLKHPLIDQPFQDVCATEIQTSKGKSYLNAFVAINKIALDRTAIKYKSSGPEYKTLEALAGVLAPGDIIVLGGDLQFDAQGKEIGTSDTADWITDKKVLKGHMQVVETVIGLQPVGTTNHKVLKFTVIEASNGAWGDLGEGQYFAKRDMYIGYPGANWGGKIVSLSPGRYNVVIDYIIDAEKFHSG